MFPFHELKQLQLEITNRCQASCPMCLRNIHGGIKNPLLTNSDWTFENFKKIINDEVLCQIDKIDFCGDFGDPIVNDELINMCRYIKESRPNTFIGIYTNGGIRSISWWKELATALPDNHKVEFALDGLADTHSLYRIGTAWDKVIKNAVAFIEEGGNAEWMFIRFKHNEHQVDDARQLSKELGFSKFTVKNSKRFSKTFKVLDNLGQPTHILEQATDSPVRFVKKEELLNCQTWDDADKVNCFTLDAKELYIDANYLAMPCCLLGSFVYANYNKALYEKYDVYLDSSIVDAGNIAQQSFFKLIKDLGGFESLDCSNKSIKDIMNSEVWSKTVPTAWKNKSSLACIMLCGKNSPFLSVKNQKVQ